MNKTPTNVDHQQVIFFASAFNEINPLAAELTSLFAPVSWSDDNVYYVGDFTKAISKSMMQEALTWASYTGDNKKVLVVQGAELLTVSAANSLLKTLESPWHNVFFWLCTTQLHLTLPTIRSRCIVVKKQSHRSENSTNELVETAKQFLRQQAKIAVFRFVTSWVRDYEPKQICELLQLLVRYWQNNVQAANKKVYFHYLTTTFACLGWIKKAPYQTKYWLEWWIWELHAYVM